MNPKTLLLIIIIVALSASCGPSKEEITKTCSCEALFSQMKALEAEYQINDRISSSEAEKKVKSENQEAYDGCIKIRHEIGDDNYFKASLKCGGK